MRTFLAMLVANMKMTGRNIAALFWNLAFPALFILMFGAVFQGGGMSSFSVGTAGANTESRAAIESAMHDSEAFDVEVGDEQTELDALRNDDRNVVLVFPADPATPISMYSSDTGGPTGQIAVGAVRSLVMDVLGQAEGIGIEQRTLETLNASYIDWFVPGIIAMSLMNSGIIGIATAFVSFREKGILRRIKVTPFPLWKFLLARIIASLTMSLITTGILLVIGWLAWDLTVRGNWGVILISIIMSALAMLAIGYAIAAFARNTEAAAAYANMITFPMMFLSGVFFPIGTMPAWLLPLVKVMPLTYAAEAIRKPMLYGDGLDAIATELLVLATFFIVGLIVAVRFFRWDATAK